MEDYGFSQNESLVVGKPHLWSDEQLNDIGGLLNYPWHRTVSGLQYSPR